MKVSRTSPEQRQALAQELLTLVPLNPKDPQGPKGYRKPRNLIERLAQTLLRSDIGLPDEQVMLLSMSIVHDFRLAIRKSRDIKKPSDEDLYDIAVMSICEIRAACIERAKQPTFVLYKVACGHDLADHCDKQVRRKTIIKYLKEACPTTVKWKECPETGEATELDRMPERTINRPPTLTAIPQLSHSELCVDQNQERHILTKQVLALVDRLPAEKAASVRRWMVGKCEGDWDEKRAERGIKELRKLCLS